MTNEEFQRSKSFEENLKEWNLLSLEEMGESVKEGSLQRPPSWPPVISGSGRRSGAP